MQAAPLPLHGLNELGKAVIFLEIARYGLGGAMNARANWVKTLKFDERFRATFERPEPNMPLFYGFEHGLRFGHSPDYYPIPLGTRSEEQLELEERLELHRGHRRYPHMFLAAMDRTRKLLRELFESCPRLDVLLTFAGQGQITRGEAGAFRGLRYCGFVAPEEIERSCVRRLDEDEPPFQYRYAFESAPDDLNLTALLWAVNSGDIGIEPTLGIDAVHVYFVDFDRRVIFHPYDDRGADIVAMDADPIVPIYAKHYEWLLDSDIEIMDARYRELAAGLR